MLRPTDTRLRCKCQHKQITLEKLNAATDKNTFWEKRVWNYETLNSIFDEKSIILFDIKHESLSGKRSMRPG